MKMNYVRKCRVSTRAGNIWNSTHLGATQDTGLGVRALGCGFLPFHLSILQIATVQALREILPLTGPVTLQGSQDNFPNIESKGLKPIPLKGPSSSTV